MASAASPTLNFHPKNLKNLYWVEFLLCFVLSLLDCGYPKQTLLLLAGSFLMHQISHISSRLMNFILLVDIFAFDNNGSIEIISYIDLPTRQLTTAFSFLYLFFTFFLPAK